MRKTFVFATLSCFLSIAFAQQQKSTIRANPKVSVTHNQVFEYPEEALLSQKEGLVLYRIFVGENGQYKSHKLLYATDQLLANAVGEKLPQIEVRPTSPAFRNTYFVSPFVFELEKENREKRDVEILMKDGNACLQYGLPTLAIHFYDQILDRKRKKESDFFSVHQARRNAFLQLNDWEAAHQEVTNMLAYSKEAGSSYASLQADLRIERGVLSLLQGNANQAVKDIDWLNRSATHNISAMSAFVKGLRLTQKEARLLAKEAKALGENLPGSTSFWLEGVAALAMSHVQMQGQAQLIFTRLLDRETGPDNQAALLCEIGWSLYNQGKVVEALSRLQEATQLSPAMAQAHFYKALSLARLDYGAEAYESMRSALALGGLPSDQQMHGQQMLSILAVAGQR